MLVQYGANVLSLQDLIAVILGVGSKKRNVFDVAKMVADTILESGFFDTSLSAGRFIHLKKQLKHLNLGSVQYSRVIASLELAYRAANSALGVTIKSAKDIVLLLQELKNKKKEYMYGIYVDVHNRLLAKKLLFVGGSDMISLHIPVIFRYAVELGAYGLFLVHNHPSGQCKPSQADISTTQVISKGAEYLQIRLLDHVIIARSCYFSFKKYML